MTQGLAYEVAGASNKLFPGNGFLKRFSYELAS